MTTTQESTVEAARGEGDALDDTDLTTEAVMAAANGDLPEGSKLATTFAKLHDVVGTTAANAQIVI